jgi:NAD(P)-dependent dehydrogenase (short-subunit alcohol dehydrogenase family)
MIFAGAPMIVVGGGAIGGGLAEAALRRDHSVYIGDFLANPPGLPDVIRSSIDTDQAGFSELNVTDPASVDGFVGKAETWFGSVNQLVVATTQGLGTDDAALERALAQGGRNPLYDVNVQGTRNVLDAVTRHFAGAQILFIPFTSIVDLYDVQLPGNQHYRLSKMAMRGLARSVAENEDQYSDVDTLAIAPGLVLSTMSEGVATMLLVSAAIQAANEAESEPSSPLRQSLAGFQEVDAAALSSDPAELLEGLIGSDLYNKRTRKTVTRILGKDGLSSPDKGVELRMTAAMMLSKRDPDGARKRRIAEVLVGSDLAVDALTFGQIILSEMNAQKLHNGRVVEIYSGSTPHNEGPIVHLFQGLPLQQPAERIDI